MKVATIETPRGVIKIQLFDDKTPRTVENFVTLANKGFTTALSSTVSLPTS